MPKSKRLSLASLLAAASLSASLCAQHDAHKLMTIAEGTAADRLGFAVAIAGDVDKDGHDDIIAGAPLDGTKGLKAGMIRVYSGKDGKRLYTLYGTLGTQFGTSVDGAGDVNKDGYADFIVGAPYAGTAQHGAFTVFSGKDGKVLYQSGLGGKYELYGYSVAGAGDVNRDGYDDYLVSGFNWYDPANLSTGTQIGRVQLRSGKTGKLIREFRGKTMFAQLGRGIAAAGDVNKDGYIDIVVGAPNGGKPQNGLVEVYSGKNGAVLHSFLGDSRLDWFGNAVDSAGDFNRDGYDDILVSAYADDNNGLNSGHCRIYSGKDGKIIWKRDGKKGEYFGWKVAGDFDIDRDGYGDVIISAGAAAAPGITRVFSGKTGKEILSLKGYQVGAGGDINGDGTTDLVSSTWGIGGSVFVYSGEKLSLRSTTHLASKTSGGTQKLQLRCGTKYANNSYWIFGSMTGINPGVTHLGVHVPLIPDLYTSLCMSLVGANPPFVKFRGKLDSQGNADASLIVPKNLNGSGTVFHSALISDATGKLHFATNAASLRIQ